MARILFIEDNEEIRDNAAEILELGGYEVLTAENGKRGFEIALQEEPDIIICDIMMPVLDGYGLLALINKNEKLKNIPFIFLTAKSSREDFRKGMEMGADDYITKPFTEIELLNAIEVRLAKKERIEVASEAQKTDETDINELMNQIINNSPVSTYTKKQAIYSEGTQPRNLFYIRSGKARAFKTNEFGKELTVNLYKTGDFVGYKALLEHTVYKESTETMEDCEIISIKREEFEELLETNREFSLQFFNILAKNISDKEEQLMGIAYNSLRKRVADAILRLLETYKEENNSDFTIKISREDLANLAGTTTESLIRTLSDFKSENLIEAKAGMVKVINEEGLRKMVN